VTGNSFAAAHLTGLVARLLGKHLDLTPSQVTTVLHAVPDNAGVDTLSAAHQTTER
jgi:subtilisin